MLLIAYTENRNTTCLKYHGWVCQVAEIHHRLAGIRNPRGLKALKQCACSEAELLQNAAVTGDTLE